MKRNYVAGGAAYKPDQGWRPIFIYRRAGAGPGDLSLEAGGNNEAFGKLDYSGDYAFFRALGRRLKYAVNGGTDFEAQRVFAGLKTDERRTGGEARIELELFGKRREPLFGLFGKPGVTGLRLFAEGKRQTVALRRDDVTVAKQNLTTLNVGLNYLFSSSGPGYRKEASLSPQVEFGLGTGRDEPRFTLFSLTGNFREKKPWRYVIDLTGHAQLASSRTPLFELPSLSGDVIRGFRRDEAHGRGLWSLQSELWLQVPGANRSRYKSFTRSPDDKPGLVENLFAFVRDHAWVAGFVDVGGIYKTIDAKSGLRAGPGVGLRVDYNRIILKLDWAYGLGETTAGRGHGRFYFNLTTNLPF
ncbi:MAG: hypothetical protein JO360_03485 [Acidobacteria bacterium]|nr:hypothetical protein [Acidobacteriota bacterium]